MQGGGIHFQLRHSDIFYAFLIFGNRIVEVELSNPCYLHIKKKTEEEMVWLQRRKKYDIYSKILGMVQIFVLDKGGIRCLRF